MKVAQHGLALKNEYFLKVETVCSVLAKFKIDTVVTKHFEKQLSAFRELK